MAAYNFAVNGMAMASAALLDAMSESAPQPRPVAQATFLLTTAGARRRMKPPPADGGRVWRIAAAFATAVLLLVATAPAGAQQRRIGSGPPVTTPSELPAGVSPDLAAAFGPMLATPAGMRQRGFFETGLKPVYPSDAKCPVVTSPFASWTRSDGSPRSRRFFDGLHSGIDIPAPDETPILAVAAGTVVHVTKGESIGGIGIVLQHAPGDTGLPVWIYTEYKHLRSMPALDVGDRVTLGQVIANVGATGTAGGHYGEEGFTHLHLSAFFSPQADFVSTRFFMPLDGQWLDPLVIYRGPPFASADIAPLPAAEKAVRFGYRTTSGKTSPENARVIWPLPCSGG